MKPSAGLSNAGKCVIIVGGGPAAQSCAETLRTRRNKPWDGRIVMLTDEANGPYDRTKLSKSLSSKAQELLLRPDPNFYGKAGIELKTSCKVVSVDAKNNQVQTESGETYLYDYLVLASGSRPRPLPVKGADTAKNVFTLRTPS